MKSEEVSSGDGGGEDAAVRVHPAAGVDGGGRVSQVARILQADVSAGRRTMQ